MLLESMAVGGGQVEPVDLFQAGDPLPRRLPKSALAFESVQHDALQQVAQRHVVVLRKGLQDLQEPLFEPNAGLRSLDFPSCAHVTLLPWYLMLIKILRSAPRGVPVQNAGDARAELIRDREVARVISGGGDRDAMRRTDMGRRFLWVVGVLLALMGLAIGGVVLFVRSSLPRLSGQVVATGLTSSVEIARDEAGVPTITAANDRDLAFAMGFVHGQERFFQMDLLRRAGAGELAALLGPSVLDVDRARRVHRFRTRAKAEMAKLPPKLRDNLNAYADGVAAGLDDLSANPFEYTILGVQPQPWRPEDSLCVAYAMFFTLQDASGQAELRRAAIERALPEPLAGLVLSPGTKWDAPIDGSLLQLPTLSSADPTTTATMAPGSVTREPPAPAEPGSNNWAVAGDRSVHGGAMIADDMHLALRMPNIWFRVRQKVTAEDGGYDATGVSLPGTPLIVAGSNGHVAWGFTNAYIDTSDLVSLEPGPSPDTYRTPDGPRAYERFDEQIDVRGGEPTTLTVVETIWGPVVGSDLDGRQVALRWVAHDVGANDADLALMVRAKTLEQAARVAAAAGMPSQNVVIAASDGRIAWTLSGRIPKRPDGCSGAVPTSWADGACAWQGAVDLTDHPRVVDPPDGRLWTANNRVVGAKTAGPVRYAAPALGARAWQIREGLMAKDKLSEADLLAVQLDDRAVFLQRWQALMLDTIDTSGPQLRAAVENWDGRAGPRSTGYRVVRAFRQAVLERVVDPLLQPARDLVDSKPDVRVFRLRPRQVEHVAWQLLQTRPRALLPAGADSWDAVLRGAVADVRAKIEDDEVGGLENYTWGARNRLAIRHPLSAALPVVGRWLDAPAAPAAGDRDMPRVQSPTFGASERFVVSPGREEQGVFHMPGGQSGHPLSPYYLKGHDAWLKGEATPFLPGPTRWTLRLAPRAG